MDSSIVQNILINENDMGMRQKETRRKFFFTHRMSDILKYLILLLHRPVAEMMVWRNWSSRLFNPLSFNAYLSNSLQVYFSVIR
jgi:hypothetical protein